MIPPGSGADGLLCRIVAGAVSPAGLPVAALADAWTLAETGGGIELLSAAIVAAGPLLDASLHDRAMATLRTAAVREMLRHREICAIVDAFERTRVRMLLIKGAGLAYTVYADAHLRPSCDVDLFIGEADIGAADRALASIGYARAREPDARSASLQRHYARRAGHGDHFVDLHWGVANRHAFATALRFDDAWPRAQPVARLCPAARTLATPDALLLGCVHRVAHHDDEEDVIWLWDIHLLARTLSAADWQALEGAVSVGRVRAVVAHGLQLAAARFGDSVDPRRLDAWRTAGAEEPSARFIGGGARPVDLILSDLAALPSMRDRARLLREHLFPDPAYIRAKYDRWPRPLLPLAYVDRIARGAAKWFQRAKD